VSCWLATIEKGRTIGIESFTWNILITIICLLLLVVQVMQETGGHVLCIKIGTDQEDKLTQEALIQSR
jgi:hypothetical protein